MAGTCGILHTPCPTGRVLGPPARRFRLPPSPPANAAAPRRLALPPRWRRRLAAAAPLAVFVPLLIVLGAALRLADPAALARVRAIVFDGFQQAHPRPHDPDLPVRVVAIDEASLERFGQWPWPRARMAELVDRLAEAGAAAIAFDVLFTEPDRMGRDQILAAFPASPARAALGEALDTLPDGDARFAAAAAGAPVVLGVLLGPDPVAAPLPPKAGFAFAGDDPAAFLPAFAAGRPPIPALAEAASGLATLNWVPARDQVVRSVPLFFRLGDGGFLPGLGPEALRVALGASTFLIRASNASGDTAFGAATGINTVRIGPFDVPTTPEGAVLMHFTPYGARREIPAWRVFEGLAPEDGIEGSIVLIGATAAGLFDLQATPLDVGVPGIEVHAQLIEHMITGTALARPDWARGLEIVAFAVLTVAFALIAVALPPGIALGLGGLALAGLGAGAYAAFVRAGLFLDPTFPGLGSALALFGATGWVASRERAQRRFVRGAFGRYVPADLVDVLVRNPDRLTLGGETREMTVLFSDIRGFTARAEGMEAAELTAYLNAYLTAMSEVIAAYGGTIDKFIGDAVMAFWNAPLDEPRHAARACAAALGMQAALAAFNRAHAGRWPPTTIGIGINTGVCVVGNLGSRQRFDYSVIGDEVNVAARLETLTKDLGEPILVGAATAAAATGFAFEPAGRVAVKGRVEPVEVFALRGGPGAGPG